MGEKVFLGIASLSLIFILGLICIIIPVSAVQDCYEYCEYDCSEEDYWVQEEGNLKVYIIDMLTKEPIIGAYVSIISYSEELEEQTNPYGYSYFTDLNPENYDISVLANGYVGEHKEVRVYEGQTKTTEIYMDKKDSDDSEEEIEVDIGDLEISPSTICMDEDENIYISLPIELEEGDDVDFKVKFYIRENSGWDYIGRDIKTLYEGDEEEFNVEYEYRANTLEEGNYKIKAEIEYNDEEETEYTYLRVRDCAKERVDFEIGEISIEPDAPTIGDMIIGNVKIRQSYEGGSNFVLIEVFVNGKLKKSSNIKFYGGEEKEFSFVIDTAEYGAGTHEIKVVCKTDYISRTRSRDFYIFTEEIRKEHCLRINNIKELNPLLKSRDKAKISVEVENCGDNMERNINLKLENSDVLFASPFDLRAGEEKEIVFEFKVSKTENLTFSVWNAYNSVSEEYNIKIYSGVLRIHLKPEYFAYANEDNKIKFSVRNTGKVRDEFELIVSENSVGWIMEIPEKIEVGPKESKEVEMIVNPNVAPGNYEFEMIAKTAGSETSAKSRFKVGEKWTLPVGWFIFAGGILPWILLVLLLLLLLFLLCLLWRYLRGKYKNKPHRIHSTGKELEPREREKKEIIEKESAKEEPKRTEKEGVWWPISGELTNKESKRTEKGRGVWWPISGRKEGKSVWWPIKEESKEEIPSRREL